MIRYMPASALLGLAAGCFAATSPQDGADASPPEGDASVACPMPSGRYVFIFSDMTGCAHLEPEIVNLGMGGCFDALSDGECEAIGMRACDGRSWEGEWKQRGAQDGSVLHFAGSVCVGGDCCARTIEATRAAE